MAIPCTALELDEKEKVFLLDADKEAIEKAAGFDQENWPPKADPRWDRRRTPGVPASARGEGFRTPGLEAHGMAPLAVALFTEERGSRSRPAVGDRASLASLPLELKKDQSFLYTAGARANAAGQRAGPQGSMDREYRIRVERATPGGDSALALTVGRSLGSGLGGLAEPEQAAGGKPGGTLRMIVGPDGRVKALAPGTGARPGSGESTGGQTREARKPEDPAATARGAEPALGAELKAHLCLILASGLHQTSLEKGKIYTLSDLFAAGAAPSSEPVEDESGNAVVGSVTSLHLRFEGASTETGKGLARFTAVVPWPPKGARRTGEEDPGKRGAAPGQEGEEEPGNTSSVPPGLGWKAVGTVAYRSEDGMLERAAIERAGLLSCAIERVCSTTPKGAVTDTRK